MAGKATRSSTPTYTREDFHYELPAELIAQEPPAERGASRLLTLIGERIEHRSFPDLLEILRPGDLLVGNDTRVVKARLMAVKDSGGRAEVLLERLESEHVARCQVRVSKPLKAGRALKLGDLSLRVIGRSGPFYRLAFPEPVLDVLDRHGSVPLPPYIERRPTAVDEDRYQTVFSEAPGAVAAPTAGLHFSRSLLERIRHRGIRFETLTLHVGAGTFQPVRSSELARHVMHSERYHIGSGLARAVRDTARNGGRVVAIGTTVVRALEAASEGPHELTVGAGETELFITPGYRFRTVDALITNFHLPESTLLMLVAAFGGHERVLEAYRCAVAARYRFFSYGDAMFVERMP
jgi:S-adenosylmethionine:tRNA ribosyltransferase-isomerase